MIYVHLRIAKLHVHIWNPQAKRSQSMANWFLFSFKHAIKTIIVAVYSKSIFSFYSDTDHTPSISISNGLRQKSNNVIVGACKYYWNARTIGGMQSIERRRTMLLSMQDSTMLFTCMYIYRYGDANNNWLRVRRKMCTIALLSLTAPIIIVIIRVLQGRRRCMYWLNMKWPIIIYYYISIIIIVTNILECRNWFCIFPVQIPRSQCNRQFKQSNIWYDKQNMIREYVY